MRAFPRTSQTAILFGQEFKFIISIYPVKLPVSMEMDVLRSLKWKSCFGSLTFCEGMALTELSGFYFPLGAGGLVPKSWGMACPQTYIVIQAWTFLGRQRATWSLSLQIWILGLFCRCGLTLDGNLCPSLSHRAGMAHTFLLPHLTPSYNLGAMPALISDVSKRYCNAFNHSLLHKFSLLPGGEVKQTLWFHFRDGHIKIKEVT